MAWKLEIANIELEQGTALGLKVGNPANPEKPMIIALSEREGCWCVGISILRPWKPAE